MTEIWDTLRAVASNPSDDHQGNLVILNAAGIRVHRKHLATCYDERGEVLGFVEYPSSQKPLELLYVQSVWPTSACRHDICLILSREPKAAQDLFLESRVQCCWTNVLDFILTVLLWDNENLHKLRNTPLVHFQRERERDSGFAAWSRVSCLHNQSFEA